MTKYVRLEVSFLFDPATTWQHAYQFKDDLGKFLATKGFEGREVPTVEGSSGSPLYLVSKVDSLITQAVPQPSDKPPTDSKKVLDELRNKPATKEEQAFKKGRYLSRKGYLRK